MLRKHMIALALGGLVLSGCEKEATGQVAAVVNGEEITLQEINSEIEDISIPEGTDRQRVQQVALQRIVDRTLLAQAARDEGIEDTPEYLLRERQMRDTLLVQLMGQRAERSMQVPDQDEIDAFIEENPEIFDERKIFLIDRIQFPVPANFEQLVALEDDHSMDAVMARLDQLGIEYRRDRAQMDTAQLGAERVERLEGLPDGEPFVIPENGLITVGVIIDERSAPITPEQARPLAVRAMRNRDLRDTLQQRLTQAKASAAIEYQEGFAPPEDGADTTDTATPGELEAADEAA